MEMENAPQMTMKSRLFAREVIMANIFLVIQFLLGMYINLYVTFPKSGPADAWRFAWHTWPVVAHIIVGTLILLAALSTLVRSIKLKNRHWIKFASVGAAAMLLSVIGGETFITTQNELASFFMSLGFLAGLLAINWSFFTQ